MESPADLAEFRLLRALRGGQPGALPTLWNAQAGAMWSVVRALCATDREAVGWMASFRVDFTERAPRLDATRPVGVQVGIALHAHLHRHFDATGPLPPGPLPPTEAGVRRLPESARLLYLVDLFFDLSVEAEIEAAGRDAPGRLEEVRALVEDPDADDPRLLVHAALMRTPPVEVLILPPGADEPPPRSRGWLAAAAGFVSVLAVAGAWVLFAGGPRWSDVGRFHAHALAQPGTIEVDPVQAGLELARANVPGLLIEAPNLSAAGLTLLRARVEGEDPPAVVLVYASGARLWTLQHYLRAPRPDGAAHGELADGDVTLVAHDAEGGVAVAWDDGPTSWVLMGDAPPDVVLSTAAKIREIRRTSSIPFPGQEPPSPR